MQFGPEYAGSSSSPQAPVTNNEENDTDNPIVVTPPIGEEITDIPAAGPPSGEDANLILGPRYGDELSLYHAILVMKVLRLISFAENGFAGQSVGIVVPGMTDYYEKMGLDNTVPNGESVPCFRGGETNGTKSVSWNNGGHSYPAQYLSTRGYNSCRHSGLNFGRFELYDGFVHQSGSAMDSGRPHGIRSGNIYAEQLKITDMQEDVSITLDGNMTFNLDDTIPYTMEITEIAMSIREDNNSMVSAGPYIEDILVHDGSITFEQLVHETDTGTSYVMGVKEASLLISVANNNHQNIVLSVTTENPASSDIVYSLRIKRGGHSAVSRPTDHAILIDRIIPSSQTPYVYNVSIDFNHNGVIDREGVYPQEYYEEEPLFRDRWGYILGL